MKETVFHFEYEGSRIRCIRAVETKRETAGEKATPWLVLALGVLAIIGVMRL